MDLPRPHLARRSPAPWRTELDSVAKATGGAMIFGVPLLFTVEMWWIGESIERPTLLAFLLATFLVNVGLARMSGFRRDGGSLLVDIGEAVEAMAVGVVVSVAVLGALGRIGADSAAGAALGTVAVQVIPLSIGAMVANVLFTPGGGRAAEGSRVSDTSAAAELRGDLAATAAGAVFVGFAIAPTEEIPMLAASLTFPLALAVVTLSLAAGYLIVFASGFDPAHRDRDVGGIFQDPFSETVLCYSVSLIVALVMLVGFGQVATGDPAQSVLTQVLVLAVPASIGGAAGRIVV